MGTWGTMGVMNFKCNYLAIGRLIGPTQIKKVAFPNPLCPVNLIPQLLFKNGQKIYFGYF